MWFWFLNRRWYVVVRFVSVKNVEETTRKRRDPARRGGRCVGDEKKMVGYIEAHLPNRRLAIREKTAQRGDGRKKNRRRHARVGDVSRVTDGGLRENETTHRNARNTTAGTSPSPSNPVVRSMRGKGSERGRAFAAGRDGARRRVEPIETRARARPGTRAPRSERVEPASRCRRLRNIVASTSSTRDWSFACEGAGETRGTRTRPRSPPRETAPTVSLPGPRSKASGRPPPRWWPRLRTSFPTPHACPSQTKTRRSVSPSLTDGERAGARTEKARVRRERRLDRDRSRPPARAENASSSRAFVCGARVVRAENGAAKRFGDEGNAESFEGTAPRWRRLMHRRVERV